MVISNDTATDKSDASLVHPAVDLGKPAAMPDTANPKPKSAAKSDGR